MGRTYLTFLVGLVILLVFSFAFAIAGIYTELLIGGIAALIGLSATLIIAMVIGLAAREESAGLATWFYIIAGVTALLLVWFLTRGGVLLGIW